MKQIGVKDAKNRFSELLAQAKQAPLTITKHGKPDTVMMSYELYQRLATQQTGLDLFAGFDWSDVDVEPHPGFHQRELELD